MPTSRLLEDGLKRNIGLEFPDYYVSPDSDFGPNELFKNHYIWKRFYRIFKFSYFFLRKLSCFFQVCLTKSAILSRYVTVCVCGSWISNILSTIGRLHLKAICKI